MQRKPLLACVLIFLMLSHSISNFSTYDNLQEQVYDNAQLNMTTETDSASATVFLHSRTSALQMGNQSTIQVLNHEIGTNDDQVNATQSLDISAFLDPQFATNATLNGQVAFALWIRGSGGPNSKATIEFNVHKTDSNGTVQGSAIVTASTSNVVFPTTFTEHTNTATVSNIQLTQGERLKLSVQITGNNGITYTARWGSNLYQSKVSLPITEPISVDSNNFVDDTLQSIDTYWIGTTGENTSMVLSLSSPLSINHVDKVTANLRDPNGVIQSTYNIATNDSSWQAQGHWNLTLPFDVNTIAGDWILEYEIDSLDAARWIQDYPGDETAGGYRIFTNVTIPVRYSAILSINCMDADGDSLSNVSIQVTADSVRRADLDSTCDSSGSSDIELPLNNIMLKFIYQNVEVANENLNFNGNQTLDVNTNVSDIVLNATHADGRPAGMIYVWVVHPNGTLMISGAAFNSTMTINNAPLGQYVISSSWMGNPLPSTVGVHTGSAGGTEIEINTTVTATYVNVTDQVGNPIEGVQLIARDVNTQTIRGAATTLANGLAAFDLMTDEYVLEPIWQRFSFPSQTVNFSGGQVNISLELHRVDFTIFDIHGNYLPFANLRVLDENNQTMILGDTNSSGEGDIRLPNGTYSIAVQWSSRYFYVGDMVVSPNANWNLTIPIGQFEFEIETLEGDSIDGAIVILEDEFGVQWSGLVTNSSGITMIRAPEGDFEISIELDGFLIHSQNMALDFNNTSVLIAVELPDIFVTVTTEDGQILDSVELQVKTFGESILDVGLTDENGTATLRAPDGVHILTARWLGIEIGQMNITVQGSTFVNFTATAYMVDFNAVDRSNQPVDNVTMLIRKASSSVILATAQTDSSGSLQVILPSGEYSIQGSWFGIEVLNTNLTVTSQMTIQVVVEVISVEINVVDIEGEALNGARVDLLRNGVFASTSSVNENGRAQFRVAAGSYTSVVTWFGIEVNRTDVSFQADEVSIPTLIAEVSSVYVEVVDRDGIAVDGVTVTIRDDFIILDQNISANGGNLRLRLPHGEYQATATLSGILVAEISDFQSPGLGVVIIEIALEKVQLTLTDLDDQALSEIQVFAHDPRTVGVLIAQSDENGIVTLRLPEGTYSLDFSWRGRIISSDNLTIPTQNEITYQLALREHTIFVKDADNQIAEGVVVTLRDTQDNVLVTEVLDQTGSVSALVGAGDHRLSISWAGLGLYSENYNPINNSTHTVNLPIGQVELNIVDLDDKPLANLGVIIRLQTGRLLDVVSTNSTGSANLYLPNSDIVITLQMQGYVIYETSVELSGQDSIELVAPVRTRTFVLHDTAQNPISAAEMYLVTSTGLRVGPAVSDGNGEFTIFLLPNELWLEAKWNGRQVLYQNLTDNQAPDTLIASVHMADLSFISPLDQSSQVVRNAVLRDAISGLSYTLPPSQSLQIPSGNHSVSLIWQDVALPDMLFEINQTGHVNLTLPLNVVELEFMRINRTALETDVLIELTQGVWSEVFSSSGNSTFVVPPGPVNMEVYLDSVLLKEVTLREELHDILLPIETYTLVIERTDGQELDTERLEVSWPGSDWILMTDIGVTGPSNTNWEARISYNEWYFEREMVIPSQSNVAKIFVEISNVSIEVLDRNGDFLKDTSCTFVGDETSTTVLTGSSATSFELLVGNYAYTCRVPSAGAVEDDGRRSSKEYSGEFNVNDGGINTLEIEVVELPFSEAAQVKGILSSGVGLTLGIAALLGWAVALVSMNKIISEKRKEKQDNAVVSNSDFGQPSKDSGIDIDDLFED